MQNTLKALGLKELNEGCSTGKNWFSSGEVIESVSPVDGKLIGKVTSATKSDYQKVITAANDAFHYWREIPAPKRGEYVRQFGENYVQKNRSLVN